MQDYAATRQRGNARGSGGEAPAARLLSSRAHLGRTPRTRVIAMRAPSSRCAALLAAAGSAPPLLRAEAALHPYGARAAGARARGRGAHTHTAMGRAEAPAASRLFSSKAWHELLGQRPQRPARHRVFTYAPSGGSSDVDARCHGRRARAQGTAGCGAWKRAPPGDVRVRRSGAMLPNERGAPA